MELTTSKRNTNLDLLKIACMFMIIVGHAILHGSLNGVSNSSLDNILIRSLQIVCYPATNAFILITGYFYVDKTFKSKKVIMLWLETAFYSVTLYLLLSLTGGYDFSITTLMKLFLPLSANTLWFIRVYLGLYLFVPFLNVIANKITKRQYIALLSVSFVLLSLWRNFIPFARTINDEGGNGLLWFIFLYFVGGFIKKYVSDIKSIYCFLIYIACVITSCVSWFALNFISVKFGFGGKGSGMFTEYTSITIFGASVSLFLCALFAKEFKNSVLQRVIVWVSSSMFGVILIHGHPFVRWKLWPFLNSFWHKGSFITLKIIISGIVILLAATLLDKLVWKNISKLIDKIHIKKIDKLLEKYDKIVNQG